MKQSKLTKDKPKITVQYPKGTTEAQVKVTGQDMDPITKKIEFKGGGEEPPPDNGDGDGGNQPPDDGNGDQQQIKVEAKQDQQQPRKVTLKAVNFPDGVDKLTIDWGVKDVGDQTPTELTKQKPKASVQFSPKTKRCTVTVDDEDDPDTEPWTKAFKFVPQIPEQPDGGGDGQPPPDQGDGGDQQPPDDGNGEQPPNEGETPPDQGNGDGQQPPDQGNGGDGGNDQQPPNQDGGQENLLPDGEKPSDQGGTS